MWSGMSRLSTCISNIRVFSCIQYRMKFNRGKNLEQVQMTTGKVEESSDPMPNFTVEKGLSGSLVG